MKYLIKFEDVNNDNNNIRNEFLKALDELAKYFFSDGGKRWIYSKIEKNKIKIGIKAPNGQLIIFLFCSITIYRHLVEIFIEPKYTGIDTFEKSKEFITYFSSLIKPLSYSHDEEIEYFLYDDDLIKLIPLLSIENYKIIQDTNKYNI